MKKLIIAYLFAVGSLLTRCDTTGVPVEYSSACLPENDSKYIEVGGFLDPGRNIFCSNTGGGPVKCQFLLKKAADDATELSIYIVEGTSANNVEKPESGYKKDDIKVYDNNGIIVAFTEKVRLTGEMRVAPEEKVCYMKVAKIEK